MNRLTIVPLLAAFATNSFAIDNVGVSYSKVDIDAVDMSLPVVNLHIEEEVNPYLHAEARFSLGLAEDYTNYGEVTVASEVDHAFGVNFKMSPGFNEAVAPYLSLGYTTAKVSASSHTSTPFSYRSTSGRESDMELGAGVRVKLDENASGFFEISKFDDVDRILTFGLLFKL